MIEAEETGYSAEIIEKLESSKRNSESSDPEDK